MNHKALLFLLSAVLLAISPLRAASATTITHYTEQKKSAAVIRITDELRIVLPPGVGANKDMEWQIISNDARVLRVVSSPRPATVGEKIGVGEDEKPITVPAGSWATTFLALRPGRSVIRYVYINPNGGPVVTPSDTREIVVTVNG